MNAYDQVEYTNRAYARTHPGHMSALGRLHGLDTPPVSSARVLDIGTSEGGNLIPLAITLPEADLVGIDLASAPIQRGRTVVDALGLKRVRLLEMSLMDVDGSFGTFDYIIAHGLYAWTPPEVRDKLLAVVRTNLSPHGMAFVSYNTYPGGHLRKLVRDMMLFSVDSSESPETQLIAARAMLAPVGAGNPRPDAVEEAVAFLAREALERTDSALYHDDLAPVFEPVYFRDFIAHATRHGLGYVADASVSDTYNLKISSEALAAVREAAPLGRIHQEQLLDLLRIRRFRGSLVCHAERQPTPGWDFSRAAGFHAFSTASETTPSGSNAAEFTTPNGTKINVDEKSAAFLRRLTALWPGSRPLQADETELALELYRRDLLELHTVPISAARASEKPVASPLVRFQAARGDQMVTTLRHRPLVIDDDESRRLLTLLDGSRTREELAGAMQSSRAMMNAQLLKLERHAVLLG